MSAVEVRVPDIGDTEDAEVIEILVAAGDRVEAEDTLLSIESDKATLEIPSPEPGVVESLAVKVGDHVREGTLLLVLRVQAGAAATPEAGATPPPKPAPLPAPEPERSEETRVEAPPVATPPALRPPPVPEEDAPAAPAGSPHASPLVRRQARELGVDLRRATGSGPHGRILSEDVKGFVRGVMAGSETAPSGGPAAAPERAELERFGPVEEVELSGIRRSSARNLMRSWVTVPHVTHHDEADVSELERFRRAQAERAREADTRLSLLPFVMKACVQALRIHPDFRSVLSADGRHLWVRQSFHLGVAVDTENGLLVPVVRDADRKGLLALAHELAELAERARARRLAPDEMQGACFSISSLGGIGGTGFTPLVNWPEVAVLGVSRMRRQPVWDEETASFRPRWMLPLSLSYDHRVIDGAAAARFVREVVRGLEVLESLLL